MRHIVMTFLFVLILGWGMLSCDQQSVTTAQGADALASEDVLPQESALPAKEAGGGTLRALGRVDRVIFDGDEEKAESYDIEYADSELRTSIVHRDAAGKVHRADAFFNIDGSLSFVRMRDAGGSTKTVHFVYNSIGDPVERIESINDMPLEKVEYTYDEQQDDRRDLKVSEWKEGRWVAMEGRALTLFVNAEELPVIIENRSPDGSRRVTFEYVEGGGAIDHYVDNAVLADGAESSSSCFVSYRAGRPETMTLRSDEHPGVERRVLAETQDDETWESGELLRDCSQDGCADVERRAFRYDLRDTEPLMPPISIVMPFLGLGSSLVFMEEPDVLLGREGIGIPTWLGL